MYKFIYHFYTYKYVKVQKKLLNKFYTISYRYGITIIFLF